MDSIPPSQAFHLKVVLDNEEDRKVVGLIVETPQGTAEMGYDPVLGPVARGHTGRGYVVAFLSACLVQLGILDERWYPSDQYWWGGAGEGLLMLLCGGVALALTALVYLPPGLVTRGKKKTGE